MGYERQERGSDQAYAEYFAGMDRSMRQKVALISSYMPTAGTVVDMGSGSGSGSFDLAALYPQLKVIGVDINPKMVEYSRATHVRQNLTFETGDIADKLFAEGSLDGILNSSVLHHVTSFNQFSIEAVERLLDNQAAQLRVGGMIAIRDFVVPAEGKVEIFLDLPHDDGESPAEPEQADPTSLSTAALFRRFLQQFRCAAYLNAQIPCQEFAIDDPRFSRFRCSLRLATEFVLRKDYRAHWETEILEEYTYFTKREFEQACNQRGLRILLSRELHNPWIVEHRFVGKFRLLTLDETPLPFPATNYIIVAEKTSQGVRLAERSASIREQTVFLSLEHYRGVGGNWDLVRRPNNTVDLVPWYRLGDDVFVLCRQGYPRPICNSALARPLDGLTVSGYLNEPISAVVNAEPESTEAIAELLQLRAGIELGTIRSISPGLTYYPSPGGIAEQVKSVLIEVAPPSDCTRVAALETGFSTPGTIRSLSAQQTLRAYQVGGMLDSRLELNIYALLRMLNLPPGPWIGAELGSANSERPVVTEPVENLNGTSTELFERVAESPGFLSIRTGEFVEFAAGVQAVATREFEYVVPRSLSANTVSVVPYLVCENRLIVGLEERQLPAAAIFTGNARILTAPAFRIPHGISDLTAARNWTSERFTTVFGGKLGSLIELGGTYYPTIGATPESVVPFAAVLLQPELTKLRYFDAELVLANVEQIQDGHLLTGLFRLVHAFRAR